MKRIILASTSPRRKEILENIKLNFEIVPSPYEEDMSLPLTPTELVKELSKGKASAVASNYTDAVVIGADTIVAHGEKVLGKPKSVEQAKEMLKMLSGTTHSVITGLTVIDTATGTMYNEAIETKISLKELSDKEIDAYIATGEPMDKAGSYAIQGFAALFVTKIEGDYFGVMGLPVSRLGEILKQIGIDII
jgi:septum formation protein